MEAEEVSTGRGEAAHLLYPDEDEGHRAHEGGLQQAHVPLHPTPSPHIARHSKQSSSQFSLVIDNCCGVRVKVMAALSPLLMAELMSVMVLGEE